jgi:hypothetical protein
MLLLSQVEEKGPEERGRTQIERNERLFLDPPANFVIRGRCWKTRHRGVADPHLHLRYDSFLNLVCHEGITGSQQSMATDEF